MNGITTKYHENLAGGSKVISGGTRTHAREHTHTHTHTQTGDLISLLSFLESRLKIKLNKVTYSLLFSHTPKSK
jgi:hypothetical protein